MKKVFAIFYLILSLTFFALPATSFAVEWWPLVPCGLNEPPAGEVRLAESYYKDCSKCDMFKFVDNMVKLFLNIVVPAVATIFFVIAGVKILLSKGNQSAYKEAKDLLQTTATGIVIIFGAWLIVNAFLHTLAKDEISDNWWRIVCVEDISSGSTPSPTPSPTNISLGTPSFSDAIMGSTYSQGLVATGGKTPYSWTVSAGALPDGMSLNSSTGVVSGSPTKEGTFNFSFKVEDSSSPKKSATSQGRIVVHSASYQSVSISNVKVLNTTANSTQITWETDKDSSSAVEYWSSPSSIKKTNVDSTPKKSHSVVIQGLSSNTNYSLKALSSVSGFNAVSAVYTFKTLVDTTQTPSPTGNCTGVICSDANLNICGENTRADCAEAGVNKWDAQIKSASQKAQIGSGIDTVAMVKAVMAQESGGRTDQTSFDGTSHGIMQMQVATAQSFRSGCTTDTITKDWLLDSKNVEASICISINYMRSLIGQCGTDIRDIAAGYNGGGAGKGACGLSTSCKSCSMCGDKPTKRWECLWDGPDGEHQICNVDRKDPNTGRVDNFNQTRVYAPKVAFCYGKFK